MESQIEHRLAVIRDHPINHAFDAFRASFASAREEKGIAEDSGVLDTIEKLDQDGNHPATEEGLGNQGLLLTPT